MIKTESSTSYLSKPTASIHCVYAVKPHIQSMFGCGSPSNFPRSDPSPSLAYLPSSAPPPLRPWISWLHQIAGESLPWHLTPRRPAARIFAHSVHPVSIHLPTCLYSSVHLLLFICPPVSIHLPACLYSSADLSLFICRSVSIHLSTCLYSSVHLSPLTCLYSFAHLSLFICPPVTINLPTCLYSMYWRKAADINKTYIFCIFPPTNVQYHDLFYCIQYVKCFQWCFIAS